MPTTTITVKHPDNGRWPSAFNFIEKVAREFGLSEDEYATVTRHDDGHASLESSSITVEMKWSRD